MPKLVVANAALFKVYWAFSSTTQAVNVYGCVKGSTVINQTLANTLHSGVANALTTSGLVGHLASAVTFGAIGIRDISIADQPEFISVGTGVQGTAVGDPLPEGVALVVTLRTTKAGRSFRGRSYLGGFSEAENGPTAQASSALQTSATAYLQAIQTMLNTNGLPLGVLSRPAEQTVLTKTVTHADGTTSTKSHSRAARTGQITPVTVISLRNGIWDSQRRRTAPGSSSTLFNRDAITLAVEHSAN